MKDPRSVRDTLPSRDHDLVELAVVTSQLLKKTRSVRDTLPSRDHDLAELAPVRGLVLGAPLTRGRLGRLDGGSLVVTLWRCEKGSLDSGHSLTPYATL